MKRLVCPDVCVCVFQAADEPAYLTVGTDVSAKYRGAFCEAKIKTVKRLVKVKVRPVGTGQLLSMLSVPPAWEMCDVCVCLCVCR